MLHIFGRSANFHQKLFQIDAEIAQATRAKGCAHCGGKLHQANYPRTGFGVEAEVRSLYASRFSFCCGRCRRRTTPPSVRFFGRRRFVAALFVLLSALRLPVTEQRCEQLVRHFAVHLSVSTWKRWRAWWRHRFPISSFWTEAKAHVPSVSTTTPLPRGLLQAFLAAHVAQRLLSLLQFVSPLSIGSV
jgi:hypothetical protein